MIYVKNLLYLLAVNYVLTLCSVKSEKQVYVSMSTMLWVQVSCCKIIHMAYSQEIIFLLFYKYASYECLFKIC